MESSLFFLPVLCFAPMLCALVSYLIGRASKNARNAFVCVAVAAEFALAVYTLTRVLSGVSGTFTLGAICGYGMTLEIDGFRALYVLITVFMFLMTSLFSPEYFAHYRNRNRYYFFVLMTLGATVGVFLSSDLFTTLIFFEIMSFTSYMWVAHEETPGAMRAAQTYLAVAVIGGLSILMGLFLLQWKLGTLRISELSAAAALCEDKAILYAAGALLLVGFGAKAGMFPMHIWLPKAHPVAPAPASALLSGILTKTGVFGMIAVTMNLFFADAAWGNMLLFLGVVTMFLGALLALFSVNLKRTLACSSVSQIGFITVGVATACLLGEHNALAARGALLHMVNHSMLKLVLFMAAGAVYMNLHKLHLNDVRGFGRKKPAMHFVFLMGLLGLAGFPGLNGYISKSLIHEGLLEYIAELLHEGLPTLPYRVSEILFIVTGGLTLAYMIKLYVCVCWEKHPEKQAEYDAKKRYMNPLSTFALLGSAVVLPMLGLLPDVFMTGMADLGGAFLHAGHLEHAVAYFSAENLVGAAKSLAIGAAVYLLIVRPLLMEKQGNVRVYVNRWPQWLDLEELLYRPLISLLTAVGTLFAHLCDTLYQPLREAFITVGTFFARICDEWVDGVILLLRRTALREAHPRRPVPVGSRFTYTLGSFLDFFVDLLNRTFYRRRPIKTRFVYVLAASRKEMNEDSRALGRTISFGLIMFCIGLFLTLFYLMGA